MLRLLIASAMVVLTFGAVLLWEWADGDSPDSVSLPSASATAMYDTNCGCCGDHIEYMEESGLVVDRETTNDISAIKDELGIPPELRSCHTTLLEGYIIEGHMPSSVIAKLLDEQPEIAGIALPAMPSGSPGMPGSKNETWIIYALEHDGSVSVYMEL
jgi:hypothetical protein